MRKRIFVLQKFVKRAEKIIVLFQAIFLLVFRSIFTILRSRYLSKNMNISVVLQRKQAIGQIFVEDVYIFPIISFTKRNRRIIDLSFLLYGNEGSFINFLKICS